MLRVQKTVCPCCNECLRILVNEDDCIELTLVSDSLPEPSKETLEAFSIELG